jgi:hypothetical protein
MPQTALRAVKSILPQPSKNASKKIKIGMTGTF